MLAKPVEVNQVAYQCLRLCQKPEYLYSYDAVARVLEQGFSAFISTETPWQFVKN